MKVARSDWAGLVAGGSTLALAGASLALQMLSPAAAQADTFGCEEAGWNEEYQCCDEDAIGNCCLASCENEINNNLDCLNFHAAWYCENAIEGCSQQCKGESEMAIGCGVEVLYCS